MSLLFSKRPSITVISCLDFGRQELDTTSKRASGKFLFHYCTHQEKCLRPQVENTSQLEEKKINCYFSLV